MAVVKVPTLNTGFNAARDTQLKMLSAINANADELTKLQERVAALEARPF